MRLPQLQDSIDHADSSQENSDLEVLPRQSKQGDAHFVFVQALLFGVPVKKLGGPRNCDVPFLLEDHGEAFLSRFKTGMAQSPIYKPQDKDTADAEKVISLNLKRATLVQKNGHGEARQRRRHQHQNHPKQISAIFSHYS